MRSNADKVELLMILGGNPVYNAPGELGFASLLSNFAKSEKAIWPSTSAFTTTKHRSLPLAHSGSPFPGVVERRAKFDGTASIVQPLIDPLYDGKSDSRNGLGDDRSGGASRRTTSSARRGRSPTARGDLDDAAGEKRLHDGRHRGLGRRSCYR